MDPLLALLRSPVLTDYSSLSELKLTFRYSPRPFGVLPILCIGREPFSFLIIRCCFDSRFFFRLIKSERESQPFPPSLTESRPSLQK